MNPSPATELFDYRLSHRKRKALLFRVAAMCSALVGVVLLAILLYDVFASGIAWLDTQFIDSFPSRKPEKAGIKAALYGTVWVIMLTAAFAIPIGIGAALYLEEFAKKGRLSTFIELNIANLAGVPSIVYGMLGLTLFVRLMGLGRSVLAGSMIMTLLILPVIIVASREALKAVPGSIRQGAMAVGASRWQTVRSHVLPLALPGMLTGVILALSRAIGETAPLIILGALTYVAFTPEGPLDEFTTLPIQIFNWASRPQADFHALAAAGIIVLLAVLLTMNALAIFIRQRYRKKHQWNS